MVLLPPRDLLEAMPFLGTFLQSGRENVSIEWQLVYTYLGNTAIILHPVILQQSVIKVSF